MISTVTNDKCFQFMGNSTDSKPTLAKESNGSIFYEMDTGDVYCFDGDSLTWVKQA